MTPGQEWPRQTRLSATHLHRIINGDIGVEADAAQLAVRTIDCAPGPLVSGAAPGHIVSPGDTLTWTQTFTTKLVGDNAAADLTLT